MGGRAPCCDKNKVRRGPWSSAEDLRLITFIQKHGHGNWRALPLLAGLLRCGKSCRLRWINYLRPDVKRGNFTTEEEEAIIKLHNSLGNKWSKIASHLPGRTDNEIKNIWNTHLKKRSIHSSKRSTPIHSFSPSSSSSTITTITTTTTAAAAAAATASSSFTTLPPQQPPFEEQSNLHQGDQDFMKNPWPQEGKQEDPCDQNLIPSLLSSSPSSSSSSSNHNNTIMDQDELIELPFLESKDLEFWDMFDYIENDIGMVSNGDNPHQLKLAAAAAEHESGDVIVKQANDEVDYWSRMWPSSPLP